MVGPENPTDCLSWEYTCTEASHASNEVASVCRSALACSTANFGVRKQPRFVSCAARPEPSPISPSKRAPAKTSTTQVGLAVSVLCIASTRSHFFFRGKSHCVAAHRSCLVWGAACLSASVCIPSFRCSDNLHSQKYKQTKELDRHFKQSELNFRQSDILHWQAGNPDNPSDCGVMKTDNSHS